MTTEKRLEWLLRLMKAPGSNMDMYVVVRRDGDSWGVTLASGDVIRSASLDDALRSALLRMRDNLVDVGKFNLQMVAERQKFAEETAALLKELDAAKVDAAEVAAVAVSP